MVRVLTLSTHGQMDAWLLFDLTRVAAAKYLMFFGWGELGAYGTGSLRWWRGQRRLVAARWLGGGTLWRGVCIVLGRWKSLQSLQSLS